MREFWFNPIPANDTISISGAAPILVLAPSKPWDILRVMFSCRGNLNQQMAGIAFRTINVTTGGQNIDPTDTSPARRFRAVEEGIQSLAPFTSADGAIFAHGNDNSGAPFSGTLSDYLGPQKDFHVQGGTDWVPTNTNGKLLGLAASSLAALCLTAAPGAAFVPVISLLIRVRG